MSFFSFLKKKSSSTDSPVPNSSTESKVSTAVKDDEEEWEDLLPILTPLSLTSFDSVDIARKRADEEYAKKYNLRTKPLQGYDVD